METSNVQEAPAKYAGTIIKKLASIMGEVGYIPKSGRNNFHKYDYATEADIVTAVRGGLSKRNLLVVPSVTKREVIGDITFLDVKFTVFDGDSGESIQFDGVGAGQDKGDKGPYKALTGALKYALLKLFQIPTGDDPELDEDAPVQAKAAAGSNGKQPPAAVPKWVASDSQKEQADKFEVMIGESDNLDNLNSLALRIKEAATKGEITEPDRQALGKVFMEKFKKVTGERLGAK